MIGHFDFTVWLTYISLLSSVAGIFICFHGDGHPYYGMLFLLISGLCDAFDGKVAGMKKDRTDHQKKYGIQIDSLTDIVAFGVLPAAIGAALYRAAGAFDDAADPCLTAMIPYWVYVAVFAAYILASLIRLAWFNVSEEDRQQTETGKRRSYTGLPVTSPAILFPTFLLLNHFLKADITVGYYALMLAMACAFIGKFNVRKPGLKGILIMVAIGLIEFIVILLLNPYWSHSL